MACVFCAVVAGTAPAHRVVDDEAVVAFLDHRPLFEGHLLVVPRAHHETLADLPPDAIGPLFMRVRALQALVESVLDADGAFVAVNNRVSQSVPHVHVHVVPRRRGDGLRGFFWPRQRDVTDARMDAVATRLRSAWPRHAPGD